ncbi:hypothetical protein JMJ35_005917 [Cladonia borealis]|uniref:Uncharacterized protein n=1 Tax=Cladonia borealis TaxID=184061 RepID=A0AA39QZZ3_9LECA|nr:hypothetical protein JMJ35_005917 [Cladonia borealis]
MAENLSNTSLAALLTELTEIVQTLVKKDLSNSGMATLLTDFTELVQKIVKKDVPGEVRLEHMAVTLEGVTDDLKTYCSSWKTATQQAEDGARQVAQGNEEIEETKKHMVKKNEELEERRRHMAEMEVQLEQRRKQIDEQEEQSHRRASELEARERLLDERMADLEKKEKRLQQQSAEFEQIERNSRDEQARLQAEAAVNESKQLELEQAHRTWKQESKAAREANNRRSNELGRREDQLKTFQQTLVQLSENVNNNLAAVKEEHNANKQLLPVIQTKHQRMRKLKDSLEQTSNSCSRQLEVIGGSTQVINRYEVHHAQKLVDLREKISSLSTVLNKQAEQAKGIPKDIQVAEIEYEKLVTETESRLRRFSASIDAVTATGSRLDAVTTRIDKVRDNSNQLGIISTKIETVTANSSQLEAVSTAIDKVTDASSGLVAASTKIDNVTKDSGRLDGISSKIDDITNFGNGLDELSTKFQAFQPAVVETLQELTDAMSKAKADASAAEADASKTKADCQRSLVHHSVSRYEESRAKRGLGPGSPEKPVSKRRRLNSVGSAGMLTNFGPPKPLPENIMDRIPSPRNRGRVVRHENARREVDTSPTRTPASRASGLLGSSINDSSSMDPATATGQTIFNPESSSPGTLLQSSQSTVSATGPPGLSGASDEAKDVWRQIEFPTNWDIGASQTLLHGFNKATGKHVALKSRPAGLLNSSSAQPNCFLCRVSKTKSALDNGDDKSCSNCKAKMWPCVRVSFIADDLANVEYDEDGEGKRWKLTVRED